MGLNIKNLATEAAIRELATKRGIGLTDAVDQAVREALARAADVRAAKIEERRRKIEEIVARVAQTPITDLRPWREINDEMYGEHGEPI